MVDVSQKDETHRVAVAESTVLMSHTVLDALHNDGLPKGDLFATARIAGIQAAKRCSDMIPLCHPLPLTKVAIDIAELRHSELKGLVVTATCKTQGKTGVEMEALTAAAVASLTIYDMCKALDKGMTITDTRLLSKKGGKSGNWSREND